MDSVRIHLVSGLERTPARLVLERVVPRAAKARTLGVKGITK